MKARMAAALQAMLQTSQLTTAFLCSSSPSRLITPGASKSAPQPAAPLRSRSNVVPRRHFFVPSFSSSIAAYMSSSSYLDETNASFLSGSIIASSLASEYAIRINPIVCTTNENDPASLYRLSWDFYPLQNWDKSTDTSQPLELRAMNDCVQSPSHSSSSWLKTVSAKTLSCTWEGPFGSQWYIEMHAAEANDVPNELVCILSRIMVQSAASHIASLNLQAHKSTLLHLTLPILAGETFQEFELSQLLPPTSECTNNNVGIRKLFTPVNPNYANMEIVDMVNHHGQILGSLPRPFVHTWNILHRGIGMIVTKDKSILDPAQEGRRPEIYVHQRTATKRIFPSLYDMFVGGVSSRGESAELTAAREIAEELGLTGALEFQQSTDSLIFNPLSDELFQCTVCTPYNRCMVSMFTYQCLTDKETITWQEEEVQWGDFVPYETVEVAGRLSIDRLVETGVWPGGVDDGGDASLGRDQMEVKIGKLINEYSNHLDWESWDFVPDGLLVWEAWLRWLKRTNF